MAQESIQNLKNALNNKFTTQKLFDEYIPLTADANVLLTRVQVLDLISDLLNFKKLAETEICRQKQLQIIHQHMENTMTRSQVASPTKQWVQIQHQPIQGIQIQSQSQAKQNLKEENALKRKQTIEEKIQFFEDSLKALKNELIQSQIQENNEIVQDYHPEAIKDFKNTKQTQNQLDKSQENDASRKETNVQKPVQQKEQSKVQDFQAQNRVEDFKKTENNQPKIKTEVKQLTKIQQIPNEIKQKPKQDDEFDFNIQEEVKQKPHANDFQMDNDFHAPAPKELKEIKKEPKALPKVKEAIQKVDEFDMDMDIDFNADSKPAKTEVAEPEEDKKQKKTKKKVKSAKDAVASVDDFNELNDSASKEPVRDVPASITTQMNQPAVDDFNDFMEEKPAQIKDEFDDMEIDLDTKPEQKPKQDDEFDFNIQEEVKQKPHANDFQMDNDFHAPAPKELKEIKKEPKALPKVKEAIQKVDEFDMDIDIDFNADSKPAKTEVAEPEEDKKQKKTKKKVKSAKDAVASVDDFNELNDSASKEPVRDVPASITTQMNQPAVDDFNDFMEEKPAQIKDEFDDMEIDLDMKPEQKPKQDDEFDFNIQEEVKQKPHANDFQMDNDFHAPAPKELKEIKKEPKALPKVKEAIQKVDEFDMDMDIDFNTDSKPAKTEVAEPEEDKKQKKTKKKVKSAKDAVASIDDFNELNDSASKEPVRDVPASITTQMNQPAVDDFNDFMEEKPAQIKDEFDDMEIDLDMKPEQKPKLDDEFDFNIQEVVKQKPHANDFQMDNDFHAPAPKELKEIKKEPKALPKVKEAIQKVDEFDMDMDIDFNADSKPAKTEVAEPEEDKKQKKTKKKVKSAKDAVASVDDFNELNDSASKEPVRDVPASITTQMNQPAVDDFNDFMEEKPAQIKDEFDDMEIDLDTKPEQKPKQDDEFDFNIQEEVKQKPHANDFQMDNDFHAPAPKELKEIKKEPKALPKVKEAIQKVDEFDMDMDIDFNADSKPAKTEVAEPEEDKKQKKTKKKVKSAKDAVASIDDFNELNDSASKEPVRDVPASITTQMNQPAVDDFNDFMEEKPAQIKDEFDDMDIDFDAKLVQKLKEEDLNVKKDVKSAQNDEFDIEFDLNTKPEIKHKNNQKEMETAQIKDEFDLNKPKQQKEDKNDLFEPEKDKNEFDEIDFDFESKPKSEKKKEEKKKFIMDPFEEEFDVSFNDGVNIQSNNFDAFDMDLDL
ncbi:Hypothetical_protein [Hexamita inflata]|uniref:Hypothetical_protein n=1 Tax=Hexamita inflata TaxID=28002 RepID=A0AA86QKX0_9EUKA|nr:Hypothetical protein HINF_LOCUS46047 [Hexamita inflata]